MFSTTCRSRSVAITFSVPPSAASINTLERIGMVLRRSTTDCTWDRHRRSVARSIVAFIGSLYPSARPPAYPGPESPASAGKCRLPLAAGPTGARSKVGHRLYAGDNTRLGKHRHPAVDVQSLTRD